MRLLPASRLTTHNTNLARLLTAQEEREYAIKAFKTGKKDVMVASGVASKGLDFSEIQHVINFSMPKEIEVRLCPRDRCHLPVSASHAYADRGMAAQDYVHQIGRTGRSGKTGIATTFVNMQTAEQTLLDLKYLLMEAKQKCVPAAGATLSRVAGYSAAVTD